MLDALCVLAYVAVGVLVARLALRYAIEVEEPAESLDYFIVASVAALWPLAAIIAALALFGIVVGRMAGLK